MGDLMHTSGASISVWESECNDCGHVSGMAEVRWPDGRKVLLSGAGCRSRRGPREALAWAIAQAEAQAFAQEAPDAR